MWSASATQRKQGFAPDAESSKGADLIETNLAGHAIGASAALGAAACWALASIFFRWAGDRVVPGGLNLAKGVIALCGLGLALVFAGWQPSPTLSLLFLAASGIIGIAVGDTLYFTTLNALGPRSTLMMTLLVPVVTAAGALWLWDETLSAGAIAGIGMVLLGIGWVLWERAPNRRLGQVRLVGVGAALLYVLAEAAGILMTKYGVAEMSAVQATFVRQLAAVAVLGVWAGALGRLTPWLAPLKDRRTARLVLGASLIGAFGGMWLAVLALKYTYAGVAATLSATSPLFILPLGAWLMKEHVSMRAIVGVAVAILGIALYFSQIS